VLSVVWRQLGLGWRLVSGARIEWYRHMWTIAQVCIDRVTAGTVPCFPNSVAARQAGKEVAGYPPGLIGGIRHPGAKWLSSQQVPAVEFVYHASLALDCAQ